MDREKFTFPIINQNFNKIHDPHLLANILWIFVCVCVLGRCVGCIGEPLHYVEALVGFTFHQVRVAARV
jgi:hypothetical protein